MVVWHMAHLARLAWPAPLGACSSWSHRAALPLTRPTNARRSGHSCPTAPRKPLCIACVSAR
eukprot:7529118-Lingulodinium_polyedra.AAC.1